MAKRLILAGLDGYDPVLAGRLAAEGQLPRLSAIAERSARFALDHGEAKLTGLAWEHLGTGLSPEDAGRFSPAVFDTATYQSWQQQTELRPFPATLAARTVVFDPPYFSLDLAPEVQGLVAWGAHDPGVPGGVRPTGLDEEIRARFGPYPATEWIYGFVWPSERATAAMADAIVRAVDARAEVTRWLWKERLRDWDLAYVVVSELHSATEALWHGLDEGHPLHGMPSAAPAGEGLRGTYRAVDRFCGMLEDEFPDATLVLANLHGMGPNRSDVQSMALLGELLYREATGGSLLASREQWQTGELPLLGENEPWGTAVRGDPGSRPAPSRVRPGAFRRARKAVMRRLGMQTRASAPRPRQARAAMPRGRVSLEWMPVMAYRQHWPKMDAFALPSFYDGRVRINLAGRERDGRVQPRDFDAACDHVERLLRECRDLRTGGPVVASVSRPTAADPLSAGPTAADMAIVWEGASVGFEHPRLGRIGPIPYRRPGGHTGGHGFAYIANGGLAAGDRGVRSAFDVVPTVIELLGETPAPHLSGRSMLEAAPLVHARNGVSA